MKPWGLYEIRCSHEEQGGVVIKKQEAGGQESILYSKVVFTLRNKH